MKRKNGENRLSWIDDFEGWGNAMGIALILTVGLMFFVALVVLVIQRIAQLVQTDPIATRVIIIGCSIFVGLLALFRLMPADDGEPED